jgi:hypothetical protein
MYILNLKLESVKSINQVATINQQVQVIHNEMVGYQLKRELMEIKEKRCDSIKYLGLTFLLVRLFIFTKISIIINFIF